MVKCSPIFLKDREKCIFMVCGCERCLNRRGLAWAEVDIVNILVKFADATLSGLPFL
jgi:hypothetical protein